MKLRTGILCVLLVFVFCLVFSVSASAQKPLEGAVICVDPGHGGQQYSKSYTGGTRGVNSRMFEGDLNMKIAIQLVPMLTEAGAEVIMTRYEDHRISPEGTEASQELHARDEIFEHYNVHFFVSIHHNAAGPTATGYSCFYKHNMEDDHLHKAISDYVYEELGKAVPGSPRRSKKGNYHILRETNIPGVITEAGFMTNPEYDKLSTTIKYQIDEARAIYNGIVRYWNDYGKELETFRKKLKAERDANPVDPNTLNAKSLNPKYQQEINMALKAIEPSGKYDPAKIEQYIKRYQELYAPPGSGVEFAVDALYDGDYVNLSGKTSDRLYHDGLIRILVGMEIYKINNDIKFPK